MEKNSNKFFYTLLGIYLALFAVLAINPIDRKTWFVENMTVWIVLTCIILIYKFKIKFSKTALSFMFVLIYLHTIGGHYTFALVPFDWVTNLFHFSRNHFDRIAHCSVGFYAFAVAEWLLVKKAVNNKFLLFTYPIFLIATVAMTYELVEWVYAAREPITDAMNYLGSQGDIWDAQKDMLADTLGAIFAMVSFFTVKGMWKKSLMSD